MCLVKKASLAEEMAQLVPYLQNPSHKMPWVLGDWCNPGTEEAETVGHLGFTGKPASSIGQAPVQMSDPGSKMRWVAPEEQNPKLSSGLHIFTYIHTHVHIHKYMHTHNHILP